MYLKEAIHECFSWRGAAGHIDVNRDNSGDNFGWIIVHLAQQ